MDARREIVSGLTDKEARRCLDLLVRAVYPSGVRHELSVLLLGVEETSHGGAREVLLENLEASDARFGLPPHAAVPDILLECWAELEKLTSLYYFTLRFEHDNRTWSQRMEEMDERVRPVTTKAYPAARLLFADFHENERREREEARRKAEEAIQRAPDDLAKLRLKYQYRLQYDERDEPLLEENGPALAEDDVQLLRHLSPSLVAALAPDRKGDAKTVQAIRQRVIEWQQQEGSDEEEWRAIEARRGS
jgi:hypothetical protein